MRNQTNYKQPRRKVRRDIVLKDKNVERGDLRGKTLKGFLVCPYCHNIYYKKEWHRSDKKVLADAKKTGKEINIKECFACEVVNSGLYEGEVKINGVPKKYRADLLHLIASFGEQAKKERSTRQDYKNYRKKMETKSLPFTSNFNSSLSFTFTAEPIFIFISSAVFSPIARLKVFLI